MNPTSIAWTNYTWNPIVGCSKISPGCLNCYAESVSARFNFTSKAWTAKNAKQNVQIKPNRLHQPSTIKKPSRVFTCSMSDMFHEEVPQSFLYEIFEVMCKNNQHQFQVLTKRIENAKNFHASWYPNVWLGVSVENRKCLYRIDQLRECPAKVRFLSLEPLLEPLGELDLSGIHWVIVGGESGIPKTSPQFRDMKHAWAREIRDQCVAKGIPFFFKQSAAYKNETGTELVEADGTKTVWQQFPDTPAPKPETEQLTLL